MVITPVPPDFKELLQLFRTNRVEYLVIGGYAVIYHGYSRSTADFDLWVNPVPENISRLINALRAFEFSNIDGSLFLSKEQRVQFGYPPVQVEMHTSISGVSFDECFRDRLEGELDDVPANLISLKDLRRNKKAAGRTRTSPTWKTFPDDIATLSP